MDKLLTYIKQIVDWEPDCSISTFFIFLHFFTAGFAILSSTV